MILKKYYYKATTGEEYESFEKEDILEIVLEDIGIEIEFTLNSKKSDRQQELLTIIAEKYIEEYEYLDEDYIEDEYGIIHDNLMENKKNSDLGIL